MTSIPTTSDGSARQRLVLSVLLLGASRMVPAGRLIDELWADALPADPPAALRTQISRLRRALGPAARDLTTADGGYRLRLQRHQLDATRFEDALAAATQVSGEPAVQILDEALALWRGPALAEFADRPFAQPEAVRLDELRVAARERRAELMLAAGSAEDAVAALQAIVAEHPDREHARGLLMQGLYQAGLAHRSPGRVPVVAPPPGRGPRPRPLTRPAAPRTGHPAAHAAAAGYQPSAGKPGPAPAGDELRRAR